VDERAFEELTEPYRDELRLHCYRLLGSLQDAEDVLQETLLAAWRGLGRFEGRSSVRTWLYRIATNASLNALRARGRRPAPGPPPETGDLPPPTAAIEQVWIEPYPDALLPETRYETRETVGLAFLAGLQRLPPRQRAALVLRDVLGFTAREAADVLETSEDSVASALKRARGALRDAPAPERVPVPATREERELATRFADLFEQGDVDGLVALLSDDVRLTMPPEPLEYRGREAVGAFFATVPAGGELTRFRFVHTTANGSPALGTYLRDPQNPVWRAYGLMVLDTAAGEVTAITGFPQTELFRWFGLPRTLRD
jgi:RNA polymerase sigma-70 factor, ECF subfamily